MELSIVRPVHCPLLVQQIPPAEDVGGRPAGGPAPPQVRARPGEEPSLVSRHQLELSLPEEISGPQSGLEGQSAN